MRRPNSLLTGKRTGNFLLFDPFCENRLSNCPLCQPVTIEFPKGPNREINRPIRAMTFREHGIFGANGRRGGRSPPAEEEFTARWFLKPPYFAPEVSQDFLRQFQWRSATVWRLSTRDTTQGPEPIVDPITLTLGDILRALYPGRGIAIWLRPFAAEVEQLARRLTLVVRSACEMVERLENTPPLPRYEPLLISAWPTPACGADVGLLFGSSKYGRGTRRQNAPACGRRIPIPCEARPHKTLYFPQSYGATRRVDNGVQLGGD